MSEETITGVAQTLQGGQDGFETRLAREVADATVRAIEARWGDVLSKLSFLPQVRTAANSARRDAALILHRLDGETADSQAGFEICTLKGAKRGQFLRFCELKKTHPEYTIRKCARIALDEIRGEEGYADVDSLGEYAAMHRSWWIVRAKVEQSAADASEAEGGAPC